MARQLLIAPLLLIGLAYSAAFAQERSGNALVRALETQVAEAVRQARPSIACILVSRSEAYAKSPYWGVPPPGELGQLGRFDATAAGKLVPTSALHRARILRSISEHDLSDPTVVPESYGSGIVLDRSGLVLTNAHVVREATKIYIRLPGRRGSWADIYASDPRSDLAVLKMLDPPADLKALPLGGKTPVRTGQFVISLANPFAPGFRGGDEPTAGYGLVSSLRRKIPGNVNEMDHAKITLHHYGTLIQTAAETTPGCSGGALLDLSGNVIGITTALAGIPGSKKGGFAIPLDEDTKRIVEVLKRGEEVEYGFLGVVLQQNAVGPVRLGRVSPGSPAAQAGLTPGDQILTVNGHAIRDNDDLFLHVGMALAGNTVKVEVSRGPGTPVRTRSVKLAKFYVPGTIIAAKRPPARFGLRVDYTSILTRLNPFPNWSRVPAPGVVVREVVPNSPADKARLQPDKVITQVNGRNVTTPAEYYRELERTGKQVELTFLTSDGRAEKVTLEE